MRSQILSWSHHDYFMIHLYFKNWNLFLNNTYIFFLKSTPCPKLAFCSTHHPRLKCHMTLLNKIDPLGHGPGVRTKILFEMFYILFVGWHTRFGIKSLKLTWLLKFNDIWPLDPYSGPQGDRQKKNAVAHPNHASNSHTKFGQICSNGLGGIITDRRMDRYTDWQTEAITISLSLF